MKRAQKKYGLENFTKTILFYCANREEMDLLEKSVVTLEFLKRPDVYNLCPGGEGGDTWKCVGRKHTEETKEHLRQLARLQHGPKKVRVRSQLSREERNLQISKSLKAYYDRVGRKQPSRPLMPFKSDGASGKMCYVTNEHEEHRIYTCDLSWYLTNGWRKGRNPKNKKPLALSIEAKNSSSGKGKKIVHDPLTKKCKRIDPAELKIYLEQGWKSGYSDK